MFMVCLRNIETLIGNLHSVYRLIFYAATGYSLIVSRTVYALSFRHLTPWTICTLGIR